ncbi:hypothetical protein CHUAL_004311 [Chamberlinius hualienensis]
MLPKYPRDSYSPTFKFLKAFLFAEIVLFGSSYYFYYKLRKSSDYRHHMYDNHRWVLDGNLLQFDQYRWRTEFKTL